MSEQQLVVAVRRGDDRAFEELYARYRWRIGSYVFGRVNDHGRAEDITQEVFMSALGRLRATEHPIAFKPWIYEIAKNACIDEFRRTRRMREVTLESQEDLAGDRGLVSSAPTPDRAVEGKQRLDDLRGAFGDLSESHHRVIVLRELEGLSYSQIGERLGMSRSVVESTLFRARRRLSQEYEELGSGRRCAQVQTVIDSGQAPALRTLRLRERRQFTRHLAHCQPCRRHAWMAGFDDSILTPPSVAGKIAALLPFPLPWFGLHHGVAGQHVASASGGHSLIVHSLTAPARLAGAASSSISVGVTAAAASVAVIAGAGGGLVVLAGVDGAPHGATGQPVHSTSALAWNSGTVRGSRAGAAHRRGGSATWAGGGPGAAARARAAAAAVASWNASSTSTASVPSVVSKPRVSGTPLAGAGPVPRISLPGRGQSFQRAGAAFRLPGFAPRTAEPRTPESPPLLALLPGQLQVNLPPLLPQLPVLPRQLQVNLPPLRGLLPGELQVNLPGQGPALQVNLPPLLPGQLQVNLPPLLPGQLQVNLPPLPSTPTAEVPALAHDFSAPAIRAQARGRRGARVRRASRVPRPSWLR